MTWQVEALALTFVAAALLFGNRARAEDLDFDKIWGTSEMLDVKDVQEELKLSEDQIVKVTTIARNYTRASNASRLEMTAKFLNLPAAAREAGKELRKAMLAGGACTDFCVSGFGRGLCWSFFVGLW